MDLKLSSSFLRCGRNFKFNSLVKGEYLLSHLTCGSDECNTFLFNYRFKHVQNY